MPQSTQTQMGTSVTNPLICSEINIVQLSKLDTDGTKEQVEANNSVLEKLCHE